MEKNYVVMTDSSADLNPALEQELGVDIIPLSVNCGDRTFLDYPDEREIKTSEFYGMLRSGANAKTAAANVETFLTAMSRHLEQGKDVLYLGFSSGLSSTYSASEIAAQELRERYPERKVLTVDTLCASMGSQRTRRKNQQRQYNHAPQPPARHLLPVKPLFHASHVLRLHFLGSGRRYARAGAKMTCAFRQNVLP